MLMKHISEPPPPIPGISTDLQALITRALAKDPALRYESAGALADEFLALFNGQTISPGTLHIAEMAREAAEASGQPAPPPQESRRNRWLRLGIEILAVVALGIIILRFIGPNLTTAVDPNAPVGRMRFSFSSSDNDKITFSLTRGSPPNENEHYQVWLGHDDGTFRDVGKLAFDAIGVGRLEFTDPDGKNLLDGLSQIQITKEQNDVSVTKPTGEVVYSSIFPPQTRVHVRNIDVSFKGGSDNAALIAGLFYYSGSYIEAAVNGDPDYPSYIPMVTAYEKNDETNFRKRNEEVINMIVGSQSDQYLDYDKDGQKDTQANGYGSLLNGDQAGYLQETAVEAQAAADAPDTTSNIRQQNQSLQICIQNMKEWTNQILPLALKLQATSFGSPEMKPTLDELSKLGKALSNGVDADQNGTVDPSAGECGALQAYDYGTYMADFPIFEGPNRIPPTTENK
jgi:hypothetical protein